MSDGLARIRPSLLSRPIREARCSCRPPLPSPSQWERPQRSPRPFPRSARFAPRTCAPASPFTPPHPPPSAVPHAVSRPPPPPPSAPTAVRPKGGARGGCTRLYWAGGGRGVTRPGGPRGAPGGSYATKCRCSWSSSSGVSSTRCSRPCPGAHGMDTRPKRVRPCCFSRCACGAERRRWGRGGPTPTRPPRGPTRRRGASRLRTHLQEGRGGEHAEAGGDARARLLLHHLPHGLVLRRAAASSTARGPRSPPRPPPERRPHSLPAAHRCCPSWPTAGLSAPAAARPRCVLRRCGVNARPRPPLPPHSLHPGGVGGGGAPGEAEPRQKQRLPAAAPPPGTTAPRHTRAARGAARHREPSRGRGESPQREDGTAGIHSPRARPRRAHLTLSAWCPPPWRWCSSGTTSPAAACSCGTA